MAIKERQCEFCKSCKEFYNPDQFHLHRIDVSPDKRECIPVEKLKKLGWKKSSSHVWSK